MLRTSVHFNSSSTTTHLTLLESHITAVTSPPLTSFLSHSLFQSLSFLPPSVPFQLFPPNHLPPNLSHFCPSSLPPSFSHCLTLPHLSYRHDQQLLAKLKNVPKAPGGRSHKPLPTQQFGVSLQYIKDANRQDPIPPVLKTCITFLDHPDGV